MSIWKIAAGVCLGLTLFVVLSLTMCASILNEADRQNEAAIKKWTTKHRAQLEANRQEQAARQQEREWREQQAANTRTMIQEQRDSGQAMQPEQKCIAGQRLEKIEGGWQQAGKC